MKQLIIATALLIFLPTAGLTSDKVLESYITNYDYDSRIEMKTIAITSPLSRA